MRPTSRHGSNAAAAKAGPGPRLLGALGVCIVLLGATSCTTVETPAGPHCFTVVDPYAGGGDWHRGNFHMHSRHSDGSPLASDLVRSYRAEGYGVLCISDHNCFGDQDGGIAMGLQSDSLVHDWNGDGKLHPERRFGSGVEAYVRDWTQPAPRWSVDPPVDPGIGDAPGLPIVIPGAEITHGQDHFLVIGHPVGPIEGPNTTLQALVRTREAGGFTVLAHPAAWNENPTALPRTFDIGALDAIEVMNGLMLQAKRAADATPLWDVLLSSGYRIWGMANDDSHTWPGAGDAAPFTAYNLIRTTEATTGGFLQALHAGAFYGSTGLRFEALGLVDDAVQVVAPGAETLRFVGSHGRILLEVTADRARYAVTGTEGYVRVEAFGRTAEGAVGPPSAWSQPFFIESAPCGEAGSRRVE